MPYGTITSTTNTFGTVDGSVSGAVPGTLTGSVGVPGPQGPAGATGAQGPAGEGVPAGGTAGQVLAKVDGVDYNTEWIDAATDARPLTDFDFTNVADTRLDTFGANLIPFVANSETFASFITAEGVTFSVDGSNGGTIDGTQSNSQLVSGAAGIRTRSWESGSADAGTQIYLGTTGVSFRNYAGSTSGFTQYGNTSITFPNASVQTIAFPGFNNAALTGNPTAPTPAFGDDDTSIATTAFVQAGLLGGTANARNLEVQVRNQSGSTIAAGSIVYISGATGNLPLITLAQANNDANSAQTIGFVKTSIANNGTGYVIVRGVLENIDTSALTEGVQLYLSPTTAGTWTTTKPSAPQHLVYVGVVIRTHPTLGTILVAVQNGYELHELHDVALASEANNDLLAYESSTDLWKNKSAATLGIATESFVTSQGYITAAGVPAFATNAQAQTGSSTTTVMSPSSVAYAKYSQNYFRLSGVVVASFTSGTGATGGIFAGAIRTISPTSTAGYGNSGCTIPFHNRGVIGQTSPFDWSKRFVGQFRYQPRTLGTDANTVNRVCWGKTNNNVTGDLAVRGVAIKQAASGALILQAHNGTSLSSVTSSLTPVASTAYDIRIVSDGAGNVTLFSNDSQIATTTGGPTTASGTSATWITVESENLATITGTGNSQFVAEITSEFSL